MTLVVDTRAQDWWIPIRMPREVGGLHVHGALRQRPSRNGTRSAEDWRYKRVHTHWKSQGAMKRRDVSPGEINVDGDGNYGSQRK